MRIKSLVIIILLISFLMSCSPTTDETKQAQLMSENLNHFSKQHKQPPIIEKAFNIEKFYEKTPQEWGEQVTGVKTRFKTDEKEIALTFDACGGDYGSGYDESLIEFLRAEKVPATLFVNERWITENETLFVELSDDPLFQIENHGTMHKPLSVNGGEAWGIAATNSPDEVYKEIMTNHETVKQLTGRKMTLFRSGTAFYDEVAVEMAEELGYQVVNFDILGDAGATFTSNQVEQALLNSTAGSIALLHMNQPTSGTATGVKNAVPKLLEHGFKFVLLKERELE
ncbi:MAG TPA: polysaccharide deacetylase family protein [Bacillota bacterium]|nr:polysaccharide deacetylase family protein [Bacillota bacterium]